MNLWLWLQDSPSPTLEQIQFGGVGGASLQIGCDAAEINFVVTRGIIPSECTGASKFTPGGGSGRWHGRAGADWQPDMSQSEGRSGSIGLHLVKVNRMLSLKFRIASRLFPE